jgi:hypothetical protein
MRKFEATTLTVSVHPEGENPVFSESATRVCIDDEAGGPFIVLKQTHDQAQNGEVRIDFDEFKTISQVVDSLLKQKSLKYD